MDVFKAVINEIYRQQRAGMRPTTLRISRTTHDTLKREFKHIGPLRPGDLERVAGLDVVVLDDFAVY